MFGLACRSERRADLLGLLHLDQRSMISPRCIRSSCTLSSIASISLRRSASEGGEEVLT